MNKEALKDVAVETAKASPPVAVVTASHIQGWALKHVLQGWTLGHTLTAVTILYVLLQICWLLWRWRRAATATAGQSAQVD